MPLAEEFVPRIDVYTLACSEFSKRLAPLRMAIQPNPDLRGRSTLTYPQCLEHFDAALIDLLETPIVSKKQGTELLLSQLNVHANRFRISSKEVASVFDDLIVSIEQNQATWNHEEDLERHHTLGRDLARQFYALSPHLETQARLQRSPSLNTDYSSAHNGLTMMSWYRSNIQVRFSNKHNFSTYLAYPFLFLHEYTAHIYAIDHCVNEIFNDGWMLYAAAVFLKRIGRNTVPSMNIQGQIFFDWLSSGKIEGRMYTVCIFAQEFYSWLPPTLTNRFDNITFELAAFQSQPNERPIWPTKVINQLARVFLSGERNLALREQLQEAIEDSIDVQELMRRLEAIPSSGYFPGSKALGA